MINWNLFEATGNTQLDQSPEQQATALIARAMLEHFNEALDNSDSDLDERSDAAASDEDLNELTVTGKCALIRSVEL